MDQKEIIKVFEAIDGSIQGFAKTINMVCGHLNGAEVLIPYSAPYPAKLFMGHRVTLLNARYSPESGGVVATVVMPYTECEKGSRMHTLAGSKHEFAINEKWFK